jgi:response regulator RpfG family c-di-GMP phosphodiesterase
MADETAGLHLESISKFVAGIVEGRDPDLGEHHVRMGENVLLFARDIGCSAGETELLFIGSSIHDIGKLSISEHILNKPARLTAAALQRSRTTSTLSVMPSTSSRYLPASSMILANGP